MFPKSLKKKIGRVLATITLITALGIATVPRTAHASGLMPWGCDLALEFGFDRFGWICIWQIIMEDNCCDPTGDSWLD